MTKIKCVIWDIDGTLSDPNHRRKHIPDWEKYHETLHLDPPIPAMKWLHDRLQDDMGGFKGGEPYTMIYVTGRPERYRKETSEWLEDFYNIDKAYLKLFMRPDNDRRKNWECKQAILDKLRETYDPFLSFDDAPSTVDMWRRNGIWTLACPDDTHPVDFNGIASKDHA